MESLGVPATRRFGFGPVLIGSAFAFGFTGLLVPLLLRARTYLPEEAGLTARNLTFVFAFFWAARKMSLSFCTPPWQ